MKILEPQSLDELQKLLDKRKDLYLFRGQSPHHRQLNSTLARELRGEQQRLPRNYIPPEPLLTWRIKDLHKYHGIIFGSWIPDEDVIRPLSGRGDPLFEVIRYIQMNPKQPKIRNAIPYHPTPTLEFSESGEIAAYFSAYKEDEDGGIFCLKKSSIATLYSFQAGLDDMIQKMDASPCLIDPLAKLNDLEDPKPKRQKAHYIFQRDLRHPIDHYLPEIEKIVVGKKLYPSLKSFLEERGITKDFVYANPDYPPLPSLKILPVLNPVH